MTKGGSREGAGRKSGWASGAGNSETTPIRVPKRIKRRVDDFAHDLDAETASQGRTSDGRFAAKSDEHRQVRSIRLTDTTWEILGDLAGDLTRADLLEELGGLMKPGSPFLSGRIERSLWNAVDERAKAEGKTRTAIMVAAVSAYLGIPEEKSPEDQRVQSLEDKIAEIQKAFAALEEKMNQPQPAQIEQAPVESQVQLLENDIAELRKAFASLEEKMSQIQATPERPPVEPIKEKKADGLDFSSFFTEEKVSQHYGNGKKKK